MKEAAASERKNKVAKDRWYRARLHAELGVFTTKELGQNQFAAACAVFERLVGESFYWTERALGGSDGERKRRAVFLIMETIEQGELDGVYADGVARQALGIDHTPQLGQLSFAELLKVLDALKEIVRRNTLSTSTPATTR